MREIFNAGREVWLGFVLPVSRHLRVANGMRYCGVRLHSWGLDRPASGSALVGAPIFPRMAPFCDPILG